MKKTLAILQILIFVLPVSLFCQDLCEEIEKEVDDFKNETTYRSPFLTTNGSWYKARITKVISKGKAFYYLSLTAKGLTINVREKGAFIIFQDGSKWSKPNAEVDVDVSGSSGYDYSVFVTLTQADLNLFKSKQIKKFKLYIYDDEIGPDEADAFKKFVTCVIPKK